MDVDFDISIVFVGDGLDREGTLYEAGCLRESSLNKSIIERGWGSLRCLRFRVCICSYTIAVKFLVGMKGIL